MANRDVLNRLERLEAGSVPSFAHLTDAELDAAIHDYCLRVEVWDDEFRQFCTERGLPLEEFHRLKAIYQQ